jgi:RNA-splicing ligase RtcB
MPLGNKLIPNVIGVDCSCGVISTNIGNHLPLSLSDIDIAIRSVIPMGNLIHDTQPNKYFEKNYPWKKATEALQKFLIKYNTKFNTNYQPIEYTYNWFVAKCKQIGIRQNAELGIGTMGGGNHLWEMGKDSKGNYWITIHSGSRNFGKCICEYHQNIAKSILETKRKVLLNAKIEELRKDPAIDRSTIAKEIENFKKELGINYDTKAGGLEYLEGRDAINYLIDMIFTQFYAEMNRNRMMELSLDVIGLKKIDEIHINHNYIGEDLIIRKGAIRSYIGERMVIPLNMADGVLIVEGKSNPEYNYSCNHGSGRRMSRGFANRNVDMEDFKRSMKGIFSTSVCKETLDEAPQAYKKSSVIIEAIEPTATILDIVKPVLNIKDKGEKISWKELREKNKLKEKNVIYTREEKRKKVSLERKNARKLKGI